MQLNYGKIFISFGGQIHVDSWLTKRRKNFYVQFYPQFKSKCGLFQEKIQYYLVKRNRLFLKAHFSEVELATFTRFIMEKPGILSGVTTDQSDVSNSNSCILWHPIKFAGQHGNLSSVTTYQSADFCDSNSCSFPYLIKYAAYEGEASSSNYAGVVSQQNGRWGACIYANHQCIWLGTFKSAEEAAMAYDSAAIKLCYSDSYRNFQWTNLSCHEPNFQSLFSADEVITMIQDDSYAARFSNYLRARPQVEYNMATFLNNARFNLRKLFSKELTPSDVSKLNRLVIPKRFAVKYFPPISELEEHRDGSIDDMELVFFDQSMRSWRFRYCYWKSSRSFVFTRGWNRFAKEKGLRPNDTVIFSAYACNGGWDEVQNLCIIDVAYNDGIMDGGIAEDDNQEAEAEAEAVQLDNLQTDVGIHGNHESEGGNGHGEMEGNVGKFSMDAQKKGLKLFGVQIN